MIAIALIVCAIFGSVTEGARITSIRSHLPCAGQPNGRDVLRCEVEGRKTEVLIEAEVNNRRGGGDVLFQHVIDVLPGSGNVRQQPDHYLSEELYGLRFGPDGQPHPGGVRSSVCYGPAYCMVPLYAGENSSRRGIAITARLDRQRTAWALSATLNHVPTVQIQRALAAYDPAVDERINSTLAQVYPSALPPFTGNVSDAASFLVDGSHVNNCFGTDARYPLRPSAEVIAADVANTAEVQAALTAAGASFSMADTDPLLGQLGVTVPMGCGCDAVLCINPAANVSVGVVEMVEFGNHCTAHTIDGRGFPLFVIEVTVENLATGRTATAYSIVKGRGHTARFWQEDQPRGRATISARAHIAPHKRGTYENAAGPPVPGGAGVMVCGREHYSAWRPAGRRLPSAAEYWGRTDIESANTTFAFQQALGYDLPVPTALGHPDVPFGPPAHLRREQPAMPEGSDLAWYWLNAENFHRLGDQCGQVGVTRCQAFGYSQARNDAMCAGVLDCTPPFEEQPIGALADLNIRARHVPTQRFVRHLADPLLNRTQAGAMERSQYLPPEEFYDEAAPGLYLARVDGGSAREAGAQTLPLSLVLEENGSRGGASATEGALEDQRHDVRLAVELDDSWLRAPIFEHYASGARGTVYYQELLLEGSQCYRSEDSQYPGDLRLGHGDIHLTFCPVVDLPVRTERHGSSTPMTMAYRADIECDQPVGSFAATGARLDVHSATRVTTYFELAVGGPADSCTRVHNVIKLLPAQASAPPAEDCPTCSLGEGAGVRFTGVCNVTLYSNEPESSHVQVGNATVLPCIWRSDDGPPEGYKPSYVIEAEPDCGWISTNSKECPYSAARAWFLVGLGLVVGIGASILVIACCAVGGHISESRKAGKADQEQSDAVYSKDEIPGDDDFGYLYQ